MTANPAPRDQVSRDVVVETALRLIEENDISALTMRRLAAELGTAVTAIYWHVGNRSALLDLLVDRLLIDMGKVRISGRTPRARITSLARQWRARLWERPHLIGLAHERGKTAAMFAPMQAALATELAAVGLSGRAAAPAIRALQFHVAASVVMERTAGRGPVTGVTDPTAWPEGSDTALVNALSAPLDYDDVFDLGLEALLDRLLPQRTAAIDL
jgi:TetR/AcrR family transcriptional regulator, tetracycline repressor protein